MRSIPRNLRIYGDMGKPKQQKVLPESPLWDGKREPENRQQRRALTAAQKRRQKHRSLNPE